MIDGASPALGLCLYGLFLQEGVCLKRLGLRFNSQLSDTVL